MPELARSVGLLDAGTAHVGYRLVTQDGRALAADAGLTAQGVEDGDVITVAAGPRDPPPRVYDDAVEAMADVVERDLQPWDAEAGRRIALWAAVLLLLVGAVGLVLQHGSDLAAVGALVVAVVLVVGAVALSRVHGEAYAPVVVAWTGCAYAAVAGPVVRLGARPSSVRRSPRPAGVPWPLGSPPPWAWPRGASSCYRRSWPAPSSSPPAW